MPETHSSSLETKKGSISDAGTYQSLGGQPLEIKETNDGLNMIKDNKIIKLEHVSENRFQSSMSDYDKYYWKFIRTEKGEPLKLFYGDKVYYNINYDGNKKFEFPEEWLEYIGIYRNYSPWFPYFEIIIREGNLVAITGYGGETSFGDVDLLPNDKSVFKIGNIDSPEQLRFEKSINGHSIIASWSGHIFYWTDQNHTQH